MAKPRKKPEGKPQRDRARELRISMEIIPDAYNDEERAVGWYDHLEDKLHVPFLTRCVQERAISPLRIGDEVEVLGMVPEDECRHEMFVEMPREYKRTPAVPLSQLKVVYGDAETTQAVEDWHYWIEIGYGF